MEMVNYFRYLGQVIFSADDDWLVVVRNLSRSRVVWNRIYPGNKFINKGISIFYKLHVQYDALKSI